jgi:hypothetical protein
MIISSNVPGGQLVPPRGPGPLLASVDVEWSKNYRIRGGNVPFCYSVIWLPLPPHRIGLDDTPFWYTSAYVHDTSETQNLITGADQALGEVLRCADLIAGHQLCSDLGTLASAARQPVNGIYAARTAWRQRRQAGEGVPRILDTRYDADHALTGTSRRLVDVCTSLRLDVTQPELRGTSMTALHRRWLEHREIIAREKITVLNLRHSVSTALVATYAAGLGHWQPGLNVNRLLAVELGRAFRWLTDPAFTTLIATPSRRWRE